MLELVQPDSPELWLVARRLVQEYAASLNFDPVFPRLRARARIVGQRIRPSRRSLYVGQLERGVRRVRRPPTIRRLGLRDEASLYRTNPSRSGHRTSHREGSHRTGPGGGIRDHVVGHIAIDGSGAAHLLGPGIHADRSVSPQSGGWSHLLEVATLRCVGRNGQASRPCTASTLQA